ncbi:MAG: glycine cleavage system aminomethyltransferase GcvT [Pseudomonadota bacterium]|nr:glycine cleavage system aminomethyltransferase GcvT [Pseudomonadota bacterium]
MSQKTSLYARHEAAGAKFVDFAGWDMPIHYGSQLDEHHAVRQAAGMFDVSHMTAVDILGAGATAWLRRLLANDVAKLKTPGKALYSCMLTEQGTVVDDLICYRMQDDWYRLVVNAGTTDKDIAWMQSHRDDNVRIEPRRELCILAVQGPEAVAKTAPLLGDAGAAAAALKPFNAVTAGDWFVGRTGYTGEDGFEIIAPAAAVTTLWDDLLEAGVRPAGLGARDTLRLEAGMNLYGQDMDETVTPLESGLAWTVSLDDAQRDFIGRQALVAQQAAGGIAEFVGVLLEGRGVLRAHMTVQTSQGPGELTSGGFSPTMGRSIGLARVPAGTTGAIEVEMRGKPVAARVVNPPFVRNGRVRVPGLDSA